MRISDFRIGLEFTFDYPDAFAFRCTDIGTRVIVAIRIDPVDVTHKLADGTLVTERISKDQAEKRGMFRGPTYGVLEMVMDEDDMEICIPVEKNDD